MFSKVLQTVITAAMAVAIVWMWGCKTEPKKTRELPRIGELISPVKNAPEPEKIREEKVLRIKHLLDAYLARSDEWGELVTRIAVQNPQQGEGHSTKEETILLIRQHAAHVEMKSFYDTLNNTEKQAFVDRYLRGSLEEFKKWDERGGAPPKPLAVKLVFSRYKTERENWEKFLGTASQYAYADELTTNEFVEELAKAKKEAAAIK